MYVQKGNTNNQKIVMLVIAPVLLAIRVHPPIVLPVINHRLDIKVSHINVSVSLSLIERMEVAKIAMRPVLPVKVKTQINAYLVILQFLIYFINLPLNNACVKMDTTGMEVLVFNALLLAIPV